MPLKDVRQYAAQWTEAPSPGVALPPPLTLRVFGIISASLPGIGGGMLGTVGDTIGGSVAGTLPTIAGGMDGLVGVDAVDATFVEGDDALVSLGLLTLAEVEGAIAAALPAIGGAMTAVLDLADLLFIEGADASVTMGDLSLDAIDGVIAAALPTIGGIALAVVGDDLENEPAGLTPVADYPGGPATTNINEINVIRIGTSLETPVHLDDLTGPRSPGKHTRFIIPNVTEEEEAAHLADPSNPALHLQRSTGFVSVSLGDGYEEIFISRHLRPAVDMLGATDGSKSLMLGGSGISTYLNWRNITGGILFTPIFFVPGGAAQEPLQDSFIVSAVQTPIVLGTFGRFDFYQKLNTPGVANGVMRWWIGNVLQQEYTNLMFRASGHTAKFNSLKTDFYQNRARTWPMNWDMDHFYVSAA